MFFDYNKERDRIWKKLEKSGAIIDYKRPKDNRKYNVYLRSGLILVSNGDNTTIELLTIDSFLYLWLECFK